MAQRVKGTPSLQSIKSLPVGYAFGLNKSETVNAANHRMASNTIAKNGELLNEANGNADVYNEESPYSILNFSVEESLSSGDDDLSANAFAVESKWSDTTSYMTKKISHLCDHFEEGRTTLVSIWNADQERDMCPLVEHILHLEPIEGAVKGTNIANNTCDVLTEYYDMGVAGIKVVEEYKVYTAGDILDLLHFVAPKMMARGGAHFSYGIAEDLDDPMYSHYKYWSNPLETKLPNAPDMEIYSMYGVGIPTERAYVYGQTQIAQCHIPFQIETSADEGNDGCLKNGVFTVDGDETVPILSAGFMCAKGWAIQALCLLLLQAELS